MRLPDGRCLWVNECARPSLHTCHKDALCIDQDIFRYGVDCDPNAACVDTPEGFQCVCQPGFADVSTSVSKLPGRKCVEVVNECSTGKADCSCNADCFDRAEGYECKCRPGFVDASPDVVHYPGRVCNKPKSPEHYGQTSRQPQCRTSEQCGPNEECRFNAKGEMVCQCKRGAVQQRDGQCKVVNECADGTADCSPYAECIDLQQGYMCKLVNECADGTADCSPYAECIDLQQGYMCKCKLGYTDVSSRYNLQPGRSTEATSKSNLCSLINISIAYRISVANQCSDPTLNSCDQNADCVQLPDSYTCKCFAGYVDVSTNANLSPGRVCTLSTVCPVQATDLVFLIDGSGSIGSYIFQTEVLRFLNEFTELFDIAPDKTRVSVVQYSDQIRFLNEFTELFDIAPDKTRVSVVQYSDQIRHEFGLGDYKDSKSLHEAIRGIEYLTGLTRTGAAIEHVANEAFSERRGARPISDRVARVCIVITDGRSQVGFLEHLNS
ncbi:unnamed protein product [Strongylus vulgaris]|uniref:VWFA domain-containing protein n=1 Tax=Strongylus vulgaris TaxID=40348 RepID=A0A3P7LFD1_STRVU|nr:unnamed protein product [Strongylus vulgaris]